MRDHETEFRARGASLAAIGLGDLAYARAFRDEFAIAFPLLVDVEREAYRAAFDPTYLIYTLGALQIRKLRDDLMHEQGTAFNLGTFHATMLSQGSIPVVLLRRLLLNEEGSSL